MGRGGIGFTFLGARMGAGPRPGSFPLRIVAGIYGGWSQPGPTLLSLKSRGAIALLRGEILLPGY